MRELKASTKAGQNIIAKASNYDGYWLHQVYDKWSYAKEQAWNRCWEQFRQTENSESFSICSHNTFGLVLKTVRTY